MPPRAHPDHPGEADSALLQPPQSSLTAQQNNTETHDNVSSKSSITNNNNAGGGVLRFAMCASGICICYMYYGMLQERLFRHHDSSTTTIGPSFVLLLQCIINVGVALLWQRMERVVRGGDNNKTKPTTTTPTTTNTNTHSSLHHPLLALTSMCYVLAMICSNEALNYVSYPTAVLAKSCKLIPTMAMGVLVEHRIYSTLEWTAALCITVGIVLFNLSRMSNSSSNSDNESSSARGLFLLATSLFFDGLLGSSQGLLKQTTTMASLRTILFSKQQTTTTPTKASSPQQVRPPNATETMLFINLYSLLWLVPMTILNQQLQQGVHMLHVDATLPDATMRYTLAFGLLAMTATVAVGQIFIFLTVTWYSSLICSTITTTRKFFTILLSVSYFGHDFSRIQWMSIGFVFSGLYLGIVAGRRKHHQQQEQRDDTPQQQGGRLKQE